MLSVEDCVVDRTVALFDGLALQVLLEAPGMSLDAHARSFWSPVSPPISASTARGVPQSSQKRREGGRAPLDPLAAAARVVRHVGEQVGGAAARDAEHALERRVQAVAGVRAPVAALLDEHQPSVAQLLGELSDEPRRCGGSRPCVTFWRPFGSKRARILPAGADDELRPELPDDRRDDLGERVA